MSRKRALREPNLYGGKLPATRDEVRLRWVSDGWYWGPVCPQDDRHGALIDLQGSEKWYCRHSAHLGRGIYEESTLIDLEWKRITSAAKSQGILPHQ